MQIPDEYVNALVQRACSTYRRAIATNGRETSEAMEISMGFLPSTWSVESNIQLMPPKKSDASDRSLFRRARVAIFDPDGYEYHRGLRRPLFYRSGYLSCAICNGVTFIDASALQTILKLKALVNFESIRPENLPPCAGCGETAGLRVGAHNFLSLIEGGKEALARRWRLEIIATKMMQRAFRRYLLIRWKQAEITLQRTVFLLQYRSTQVIQAMVRGRLGRRVFQTEKWLLVIKNANRVLIQHALSHYPHRKRVFWYANEAEEEQIYSDYRVLVQRSGYLPPRTVVEGNICEIAKRVLEREAELVGRIQARWRGLSVRRYLVVFRKEKGRQREVRASMIFRIQRIVRGWSHRKHAIGWYSKRVGQKALAEYLAKKLSENYDNACTDGMTRLRKAYITERQEELTARLMGHTEMKLAGGLKMKAFYESPYGDDGVTQLINHQVCEVLRRKRAEEEKDHTRQKRAEWVRLKQMEDPQLALYFRDEISARNSYVINKLRSEHRPLNNIASVLRHHNQNGGRKYDFPGNINRDPMACLFERHSTDGQALLRRYSRGGEDRRGN